ncbi:DNA cytosine methyltransferase [Pseudomonas fluorescens]|uniref:Cytosine-specific methyltransferase n=1 Tax=Pseudomonas fluorescens TaxID=294 RepID=A0A5E7EWE4_PSEFL|nr:DNA cytosine methyltransferase [Pseudomonas fluorescens]VVO30812.1 Modification methylase AplI [Pseudomonas fluorescens]
MNVIDLFSGPGGLSLGLRQAGFKVIANVEFNKDAMATYISHDVDSEHFNQDIQTVSFERYRGKVDLIAGGPPCQPFSIGGLRKAAGDSRDMIPEYIRCLREAQPEAFIMENVPGLTLKRTRPYFDRILSELANCGYFINWAIVSAADYGVPQKRKRLFVLGCKHKQLLFPAPTHGPNAAKPHLGTFEVLGAMPIGEAPDCPVVYAKSPDLRPSPYAGHVFNGGGRAIDPNGPCHTILASSGGHKTHWIDTLGIVPEYHAHLKAGGAPRTGHLPGARRLSVQECALIQTFPVDLQFSGKRSAQYKQVGDAVPPVLAFAIADAVYKQLQDRPVQGLVNPYNINMSSQGELFICQGM